MKPLIPHLLVLAVLCAQGSGSLAQGIYVKQGPNGPVFSDQPLPGAREVQLKPLNVMKAPPAGSKAPTAEDNAAGPKVMPVDVTKAASWRTPSLRAVISA